MENDGVQDYVALGFDKVWVPDVNQSKQCLNIKKEEVQEKFCKPKHNTNLQYEL